MRLSNFVLIVIVAGFGWSSNGVLGQNQSPEFIESSSPLPGGGQVISRSVPGSDVQTVVTVPENSIRNSDRTLADNRRNSNMARESSFRQSTSSPGSGLSQNNFNQSYPYPATNPASHTVAFHPPVRATANRMQLVPYQIPALGLSNTVTARRAQGIANCQCIVKPSNLASGLQVQAVQAPVLPIQPSASQTPTLAVQDPSRVGQIGVGNAQTAPYLNTPSPQIGLQQNRWWTPIVSGSGVYQPIVRVANVPPGTNIGQGIIGQPTAYVDGQPIRNLMRYVFP